MTNGIELYIPFNSSYKIDSFFTSSVAKIVVFLRKYAFCTHKNSSKRKQEREFHPLLLLGCVLLYAPNFTVPTTAKSFSEMTVRPESPIT